VWKRTAKKTEMGVVYDDNGSSDRNLESEAFESSRWSEIVHYDSDCKTWSFPIFSSVGYESGQSELPSAWASPFVFDFMGLIHEDV